MTPKEEPQHAGVVQPGDEDQDIKIGGTQVFDDPDDQEYND